MIMPDFRRMAAKMDQHMQQLDAQGVTEPHQVINRMMGYTPELHQIWTGTTDKELIGVSLDIENYCTLRLFFDLSTLAGLSRRNLPEAGIRLLFQI
nr:hypothetical protein Sm1ap1_00087 [Serratia proteamaculans]